MSKYTYFEPSKIEIGGHTISLKSVKEQVGHDDSLPYAAILYIDNKKVAIIFNDGWGGETQYSQIFNNTLLEKAEDDIKGLPYPKMPYEDVSEFDLKVNNILTIADIIAYNVLSLKLWYKKKKDHIIAVKGISVIVQKIPSYFANIESEQSKEELLETLCKNLNDKGYVILSAPHICPN